MKFLCDVHISYKLLNALNKLGFDCIHVNNILDKWYTKDTAIAKYVDENNLILITKDLDFKNNFFINKTPKRIIKINLGNISNVKLIEIFTANIDIIYSIATQNQTFMIEIDEEKISFTTI